MFNILIVEDDYELRHLFQRVLIQNGYRVRGVEDGKGFLHPAPEGVHAFI